MFEIPLFFLAPVKRKFGSFNGVSYRFSTLVYSFLETGAPPFCVIVVASEAFLLLRLVWPG